MPGERSVPVDDRMREPPAVELNGVTTTFGDEVVFYRLCLSVRPGSFTVLLGPSGAGKATLVRHVLGLDPPDEGQVLIGEESVWDAGAEELRRLRGNLGVLLGGSLLFSSSTFASLTVRGNLAYPLRALEVGDGVIENRVRWWLRTLDLDEVADRTPDELAAHTLRRVALGKALIADAPLVVLDEVDTSLDTRHYESIVAALRSVRARTGATVIMATHDLRLARDLADQAAILMNGRIVATGPPKELLAGVESGEEFERRFGHLDELGPPDLRAAVRADREARMKTFTFDPVLLAFVIGSFVIVSLAVFLIDHFGPP